MTEICRITVLLAAILLAVPGVAAAQAEVRAKVDWESEKPRRVQFQSPLGNSDFTDRTNYYLGEESFADRVYQALDIVVRYSDGTSVPFRVRGQIGADLFAFTVHKPSPSVACNLGDAGKLERAAQSTDQTTLVSAVQTAYAMLSNEASPCPGYLVRRVAKANFDANCNLAKQTTFFDISPDARRRLLEAYEGHTALPGIQRQIEACEKQVRGQVVAPAAKAMRRAINTGDIERYRSLDRELGQLLEEGDWQEGAAAVDLSPEHFEQLRVEATALENSGNDIASTSLEAATDGN
ncbi:hypothetical protein GRI89_17030 [Altererythrobacter salegens]|uniref:Uncharacterized protein n=1 Tax=Croceibacterium salegens TaxID=1737568 RepID=A0A6I4SZ50_9SPHN|nr:hypothetical protein [Croceibacterium salegens]MXO61251.1 hypothetical protein [Croceibacterium salegens]